MIIGTSLRVHSPRMRSINRTRRFPSTLSLARRACGCPQTTSTTPELLASRRRGVHMPLPLSPWPPRLTVACHPRATAASAVHHKSEGRGHHDGLLRCTPSPRRGHCRSPVFFSGWVGGGRGEGRWLAMLSEGQRWRVAAGRRRAWRVAAGRRRAYRVAAGRAACVSRGSGAAACVSRGSGAAARGAWMRAGGACHAASRAVGA